MINDRNTTQLLVAIAIMGLGVWITKVYWNGIKRRIKNDSDKTWAILLIQVRELFLGFHSLAGPAIFILGLAIFIAVICTMIH